MKMTAESASAPIAAEATHNQKIVLQDGNGTTSHSDTEQKEESLNSSTVVPDQQAGGKKKASRSKYFSVFF